MQVIKNLLRLNVHVAFLNNDSISCSASNGFFAIGYILFPPNIRCYFFFRTTYHPSLHYFSSGVSANGASAVLASALQERLRQDGHHCQLIADADRDTLAATLHSARAHIGGMNHFLLPASAHIREADAGRYGNCAMHMLFEAMLQSGARRESMQAKIFGGARVMQALASTPVGADNTAFVRHWLHQHNIPITAQDVLGTCPRKVLFFAASGTALVRRQNFQ